MTEHRLNEPWVSALRAQIISAQWTVPRPDFSLNPDVPPLGVLRSADLVLNGMVIEAKTFARRLGPQSPEAVARLVLRSAEEHSVIPCSVSGPLHGLDPAPPSTELLIDGQHRLSAVETGVRLAAGTGKTAVVLAHLLKSLAQRIGRLNRDGQVPTESDFARVADDALTLSKLLLGLVQNLLTGCVKVFKHLIAVPPNESSPCGVLRLAVRRVPRAPGVGGAGRFISPIGFPLAS
ncbi:hypothetical protein [Streptomyces carpaticus]|uniref:hypothetical protein n=1 Tax=Streptomyces carpaticus TaxID=285558 RepID=UPI0031F81F97